MCIAYSCLKNKDMENSCKSELLINKILFKFFFKIKQKNALPHTKKERYMKNKFKN